jgi:hypothetical protein
MDQNSVLRGLVETAADSIIWTHVGPRRDLTPNRIRTLLIRIQGRAATSSRRFPTFLLALLILVPPPTVSSEALIGSAMSRNVCFERVRNENPLPTAANPLRLLPTILCSTRNTVMSAFIRALDTPSKRGRRTSIWTAAFGGGQVGVKTNAPATLMSRVTPSPWKGSLSGPFQWKTTEVLIR